MGNSDRGSSDAGRFEAAVLDLDLILESEPKRPLMRRMRSLLRAAAGDSPGATADLDAFLAGRPPELEKPLDVRRALDEDGGALTDLENSQSPAPLPNPELWGRQALVRELILDHEGAMDGALARLAALSAPDAGLTGAREPALQDDPDFRAAAAGAPGNPRFRLFARGPLPAGDGGGGPERLLPWWESLAGLRDSSAWPATATLKTLQGGERWVLLTVDGSAPAVPR